MNDNTITIEDLVDGAIITGFRNGTASFLESLEMDLQNEAVIEEAGDAHNLLQSMIDMNIEEQNGEYVNESIGRLNNKLNYLFG